MNNRFGNLEKLQEYTSIKISIFLNASFIYPPCRLAIQTPFADQMPFNTMKIDMLPSKRLLTLTSQFPWLTPSPAGTLIKIFHSKLNKKLHGQQDSHERLHYIIERRTSPTNQSMYLELFSLLFVNFYRLHQ